MKKKILTLMIVGLLALTITSCGGGNSNSSIPSSQPTSLAQRFTVAFEVDGERYKTASVKEGEVIQEEIPNPSKEDEGYRFVGWYLGDTLIDLSTYVVTENITLTAKFEEINEDEVLNVDDVKDATKEYHLVLGWWEVNDPSDPTKVTSGLTKDSVRLFYQNLINYLKLTGSTDEQIAAISFRNYSSATVAEMGTNVNTDGDVDLLIGVGNNVFTTAGVVPYDVSENSKFSTVMGAQNKERYVALVKDASDLAVTVYDWLQSDTGKQSFLKELTEEEITASLAPVEINLTVTVHGDTSETTLLDSEDKVVTMPTITVPEGKMFKGFAISEGGEVVLSVQKDASLKYGDLKSLVSSGANTLDLYPVIVDQPVEENDLVVYVQTHSTRLPTYEAELLEARFNSTLNGQKVQFNFVEEDAAGFTETVNMDPNADVIIGGNNPVANFTSHQEGAVVNAGSKHFNDTSRKVAILSTVGDEHLELAKSLYNFVASEAVSYEVHTTFWTKENEWVTVDEVATIKAGIESQIKTYLNVDETETLLDKYNVTLSWYEATNTTVAELGAETNALRDGKGTDLIVGCGANVSTTGQVEVVEKKIISTSMVADNRYVALVNDNGLTREVYTNYFVTDTI